MTEPVQELGEVGVDDGLVVLAEPAAGLAGGEAEDGRADQAFGPGDFGLGQTALAQRGLHRVAAIRPAGWRPPSTSPRGARAGVLLPVQEQVTVMALARDRIEAAGLATAVPGFAALAQVQDKVSAFRTLARVGVPQS